MKLSKLVFVAIAVATILAASVQAKSNMKRVYIYGFASSFNDSTVYFTDVQAVDSAWLTSKNKFLVSRENYSYQLRDYLEDNGFHHPTCMVSYDTSLKKLTKKYEKLRKKYTAVPKMKKKKSGLSSDAKPRFQVKTIGMDKFLFTAVADDNAQEELEQKKSRKMSPKKAIKQAKREGKRM